MDALYLESFRKTCELMRKILTIYFGFGTYECVNRPNLKCPQIAPRMESVGQPLAASNNSRVLFASRLAASAKSSPSDA